MQKKTEPSQERIRATLQPHQLSLVKHKSIDGADSEFRHASLLARSYSLQAKQNFVLEVKQTAEGDGTYTYSMERVAGGNTLRQFMRNQEFKSIPEEARLDLLYKLMPAVVKAARFLKQQYPEENFVISPEMVLFHQQTAKLSVVALEQQSAEYEPLYSGISKENGTVWSIALMCDEFIRGGSVEAIPEELNSKKTYECPPIRDPNLMEFLTKVLGQNQTLSFEQLEQLFEHPKDQLICSSHFKKVVKVDTEFDMLLCEECLKEEFYEWEFEKAECRKALDSTIDFYKHSFKHFERLISFAKGEQPFSKELEESLEGVLEHLKDEYNESIAELSWRKLSVVEQSEEIARKVQSLNELKDTLRDKYLRRMKKLICDWVRSEILK